MHKPGRSLIPALLAGCLSLTAAAAGAAELPKATEKILAALKLEGKPFLAGLDEEARSAPAAWIEAAKKEGATLTISGSSRASEFAKLIAPFRERYPFLSVTSNFGNNFARATKPLIAFKEGRIIADIVEGAGEELGNYLQANALEKLDDMPNFAQVPAGLRDPKGYFVGFRMQHWCMTANTRKVASDALPASWDDLVTKLRGKRVGLGNNPNTFMIMLWEAKGADWGRHFMDQLFGELKPQLRKEGPTALVGLVAAGELDVAFPTASYRTADYVKKGAPVDWHCPEPVPISFSPSMILRGAPHLHAAKLYVNWLLSREGQIAQFYANGSTPVHKDLQLPEFVPYAKEIIGRPQAVRSAEALATDMLVVDKIWNEHWLAK